MRRTEHHGCRGQCVGCHELLYCCLLVSHWCNHRDSLFESWSASISPYLNVSPQHGAMMMIQRNLQSHMLMWLPIWLLARMTACPNSGMPAM